MQPYGPETLAAREQYLREKHQGYHYEHVFAYDFDAMRDYHYLMHIARMLNEMMLYSVNLFEEVKAVGIQAFLKKLFCVMRHRELKTERLRKLKESPWPAAIGAGRKLANKRAGSIMAKRIGKKFAGDILMFCSLLGLGLIKRFDWLSKKCAEEG